MTKPLLLSVYRSIVKSPFRTLINIVTLAIGIASVLFVANLVSYETNYDKVLTDLYRVEAIEGGNLNAYISNEQWSDILTEVEFSASRLVPFSEFKSANLRYSIDEDDKVAYFKRAYFAGPEIIDHFKLNLIIGHARDLGESGKVFISESRAVELFGNEWRDKLSETTFQQGKGSIQDVYHLAGVYEDRPSNTHIVFDALFSFPDHLNGQTVGYGYVKGANEELNNSDKYYLRPVNQIHIFQGISNEAEAVANLDLLMLLVVVVFIVLLITIANYLNSTIIHFVDRCKDVSIRKLHGASIGQLTMKLFLELLLVNLMAGITGLGLFMMMVKFSNQYHLLTYPSIDQVEWALVFIILGGVIIFNSLLSLSYPYYFMGRIQLVTALKGTGSLLRSKAFGQAGSVIKGLLIFQIMISVLFLSGSLIIYQQLQLINGPSTDQEILIKGVFPGLSGANDRFVQTAVGFLDEMTDAGDVLSYSFSNLNDGQIKSEQAIKMNDGSTGYLTVVDPDYKMGELSDGHSFNPSFGMNQAQVILDSALAFEENGFDPKTKVWSLEGNKYNAIGITDPTTNQFARAYVSGFRYLTYFDLVLNYRANRGDRIDQFLEKIEYIISTRFPYFFLLKDEQEATGKTEEEVMRLFFFFGGISVLVAVIGMLGLSHFLAQKKSREVGIRKVLGAHSMQILVRLLGDFIRLILIGGIISIPFTYYGANYWLENYVRRIDLDPLIFAAPILILGLVALIAVIEKSWKAATLNPIDILDER